ncbi:hypothetical protein LCAZH_2923 [Lacticaseibacillus paracasei]|nr:hypothetical protein LCAZH_2923 [Lacticaseibacillus paracasei]
MLVVLIRPGMLIHERLYHVKLLYPSFPARFVYLFVSTVLE